MIATILHHGLCECFFRMGKTTNTYSTIQRISSWVSVVIYAVLMIIFVNSTYLLPFIGFAATLEQLALLTLPVPKGSAAFKLQKIDWENKGWIVDDKGGSFMLMRKPTDETNDEMPGPK